MDTFKYEGSIKIISVWYANHGILKRNENNLYICLIWKSMLDSEVHESEPRNQALTKKFNVNVNSTFLVWVLLSIVLEI